MIACFNPKLFFGRDVIPSRYKKFLPVYKNIPLITDVSAL